MYTSKYPKCVSESKKGVIQREEVLLHFIQILEERQKILLACHIDSTPGHMGKTRTLYMIKEKFMLYGFKDVVNLASLLINW